MKKNRALSVLLAMIMIFVYMPIATYAADTSHVEDIGFIEAYDGEDIFEGCRDLNSYITFEVDDPIFITAFLEIEAKKKTTDKLHFIIQKKEKNGYKNCTSFNISIENSKTWSWYCYNNRASDKLKKGHYRLKIVPKKNSKSFYKVHCYVDIFDSIKAVSPAKLKKTYKLWPGQSKVIAKSNGSAQLYVKGINSNTGFKHAVLEYYSSNNMWLVSANSNTPYTVKEKLTVSFPNGKKKTTTVTINPLRWYAYTLYEGQSFNEYYYRWNGTKWGKWALKNVQWYSTNSWVASVNKYGKVKAKNIGTCYIVGKYKNKTAKCKVTVYASKPRKGMTKKQVLNSRWGSPTRKNDYGNGRLQWVYEWDDGETDYVYFRNGRVTDVERYNY